MNDLVLTKPAPPAELPDNVGTAYLDGREAADLADNLRWLRGGATETPANPAGDEQPAADAKDTGGAGGGQKEIPAPDPDAPGIVARIAGDVGAGIMQTPRAMVGGARDAVQNTLDLMDAAGDWLNENVADLTVEVPGLPEWLGNPASAELPEIARPESVTGGIIHDVTQFLVGFALAGRALRAAGVGRAVTTGGQIAQGAVKGALADFSAFDAHEARLANLIEAHPALSNPVTEYLAADPQDGEFEGRFKNAVEGLGLGAATDGLMLALRAVRQARAVKAAASQTDEAAQGVGRAAADAGQDAAPGRAGGAAPGIQNRDILLLGDPDKPFISLADEADAAAMRGAPPVAGGRAININLARLDTADDVNGAIDEAAALFADNIDTARRGVQSNAETAKLAAQMGMTPGELLQRRAGEAFNAEQALAARQILVSSGEQLTALAKKAASVDASAADLVAFRRALSLHAGIQAQVSGLTAEAGRALQAFRIAATGSEGRARAIRDLLDASGGAADAQKMAAMIGALDDPAQIAAVARGSWGERSMDAFLEVWINALLSGPQTHAVNTLSNGIVALWQVPERALAARIGKMMGTADGVAAGEATAQAFGMVKGFRDGMAGFARVLRTGEPSDILGKVDLPHRRAISAESLELSGPAGRAADLLGEAVRLPGRFLTAEDELFKTIGYRMEMQAQAFRQAAGEGLSGPDLAARVREIVASPPENLHLAAVDAARYQTFTNALGTAGTSVQRAVNDLPPLRLLIPFIRTPANIMKYVAERTPMAPVLRGVRADIAAGGARRDLALARMALGSTIMASIADATLEGGITGGGPSDPGLRAAKRNTGWQPYSVKIGDTYYAFNRLDPLGATFGIAADMAEILGQVEDPAERESLAVAMVGAVSKNVVSKTYLSGISDLFEMMSDPDRYGERWLQRYAGTLVPTGVAQVERVLDPTLRDAQSMIDEIKGRLPGYSDSLPPRRNLWGEPIELSGGLGPDIISPIYTSEAKVSPVDEEIVRHRVNLTMPSRSVFGVELTPEEYDRYVQLAGEPARADLEAIVTGGHAMSARYNRASDGPDGGKALVIRDIVSAHRTLSRARLLEEFPELRDAVEEQAEAGAEALRAPGTAAPGSPLPAAPGVTVP